MPLFPLKHWRPIAMALALVGAGHALAAKAELPWHASRQMVVVTTDGWSANHGTMRTFTRGSTAG